MFKIYDNDNFVFETFNYLINLLDCPGTLFIFDSCVLGIKVLNSHKSLTQYVLQLNCLIY